MEYALKLLFFLLFSNTESRVSLSKKKKKMDNKYNKSVVCIFPSHMIRGPHASK